MTLCTSVSDPLRITTTLSGWPVSTRFLQALVEHQHRGEDEHHQRHAAGRERRGQAPRP
jgi:hypothetical protein